LEDERDQIAEQQGEAISLLDMNASMLEDAVAQAVTTTMALLDQRSVLELDGKIVIAKVMDAVAIHGKRKRTDDGDLDDGRGMKRFMVPSTEELCTKEADLNCREQVGK
jgi:hypothetical protein